VSPSRLSEVARGIGALLALASCWYIGQKLWAVLSAPEYLGLTWPSTTRFLAAWVSCSLAIALLSCGWFLVVRASGAKIAFAPAFLGYALSQPAKYLPGNLLHFAARHAYGRADGHSHGGLLVASVLEAGLLVMLALLLAILFSPLPAELAVHRLSLLVVVVLSGLLALMVARRRWPGRASWSIGYGACGLGYFLFSTLAFALLAVDLLDAIVPGHLLGAVALSWIGGFLVIGAPGGIGVREALLLQFLNGTANDAELLALVISFRIVLVAADFTLFAIAWMWQRSASQPARRNATAQSDRD